MGELLCFDDVRSVVGDIAKENNITTYHINVKEEKFTGDNYTSKIVRAQIIQEDHKDENNKQINLLIKLTNMSQKTRDKMSHQPIYHTELSAYTKILPTLYKFQESYNIPSDKCFIYPKFYKGGAETMKEYIIFEDASYDGYKMYERRKPLDYEHMKVILQSLAHYHAISFAMRENNPQQFEKLKENIEKEYIFSDTLQEIAITSLAKITPQWKNKEKVNILNKFVDGCGKKIAKCLNSEFTSPYNVICHGDFHINNMLFKYKGTNSKPKVLFLDWQVLKYGSPATDIMTIFFITTEKSFRDKYFKQLCNEEYYNTLDDSLRLYGCDVNKLYPRKVFNDHLTDLLPHGLTFGILGSTILLREPGEESTMDTMLDENSDQTITATDEMLDRLEGMADDIAKYERVKKI